MKMKNRDIKKISWARRFITGYFKALVGLLATGCMLLLLLWGILQTSFARNLLSDLLSTLLSNDTVSVTVQGLHGWLPFEIAIDAIEITDLNGPYISLKKIEAELNGRAFFQRLIHIKMLHIDQLRVHRVPEGKEDFEIDFQSIPWGNIPAIKIDRFDLASCRLGSTTNTTQFSLQGRGSFVLGRAGLVLHLLAKGDIQGSYTWHGALTPVPTGLNVSLSMESEDLAFRKYTLDAQTGTLRLRVRGANITGNYTLSIERDGYETLSSGSFEKGRDRWALPWIELKAPAIYIGGSLNKAEGQPFIQGEFKGAFDQLSYLGEMWNLDLDGRGDLYLGFNSRDSQQYVMARLDGYQLRYRNISLNNIQASLSIQDLFSTRTAKVRVVGQAFHKDEIRVDQLLLTGQGDMHQQVITLESSGAFIKDYNIQLEGSLTHQDAFRMDINHCQGTYGQTHLKLLDPIFFKYTTNTLHLSDTHLSLGTGVVHCAGYMNLEQVDIALSISNLPLANILIVNQWVSQGELEGHLSLKGSPEAPCADLQLIAKNTKAKHAMLAEFPPVQIQGALHIETNHLAGNFEVSGDFIGSLKSDMETPCIFQILPVPAFEIETNAHIQAALHSTLQMSLLNRLPMADDMKFAGLVSLNLYHQGPINGGSTTGSFSLADGSFRYFPLGTHITNINMAAEANGEYLVLTHARATDLDKGYITATGHLALIPNEQFPYNWRAIIENTHVIDRNDLSMIASGDITVSGTSRKLTISGITKIEEAMLNLDKIESSAGVMQQSIYDDITTSQTVASARASSPPLPVSIHIQVDNPGHFAARGRGLDSLWEGTLLIGLKNQEITLVGHMKTRRGTYRFMGRSFDLRDGEIRFDGVIPPDPILDIHANYTRTDIAADLSVLGRISDPELLLSSTPVMPEDEIISQILFGKSMSTITPMQALTVASTLATMNGKGNTFAFMDKTREILGVDQLEFQESGSEEGETELVAGKYMADGLYLEVNTALGVSGGTRISAEYELTPHLTIETDAGANMRPGIGFNWKRDY